jgi:hypothetical protein
MSKSFMCNTFWISLRLVAHLDDCPNEMSTVALTRDLIAQRRHFLPRNTELVCDKNKATFVRAIAKNRDLTQEK